MIIKDISKILTIDKLMKRAKWLEGKTLIQAVKEINQSDGDTRVSTKAGVGYAIEEGFFGIKKNSTAGADIAHLGVEIKTCPLKYSADRTKLSVKEPLSLNIINYTKEVNKRTLLESSLYAKNKKVLFVFYIHDDTVERSQYVIKYVFLWEMDAQVIAELEPDYEKIIASILDGKAHEIHQYQHEYLTLCPKHSGTFNDPLDRKSKTVQPFSNSPAEIRAYRLKNSYMNMVICREYGFEVSKGGWTI
ncbi:MAG: MutH/Sau3AI family endonuclease [Candidatus Saccharimonadales bacterium]